MLAHCGVVYAGFISNLLRGAFLLEMPKREDIDANQYLQHCIGFVHEVIGGIISHMYVLVP